MTTRTASAPAPTWTHRGLVYHSTAWAHAPGYGAKAWCLACDWSQSWGNYDGGPYSGDRTPHSAISEACFAHEDATAERAT